MPDLKKCRVHITERAEQDLDGVLAWFRDQKAASAGVRWFAQLMAAIETLETMPERCALAEGSAEIGLEIRELYIGKRRGVYRVLFPIRSRTVHILRIWQGARDAISRDEL